MGFRSLRVFWCDNRGSALVEGAVVVPVLFILFFGVFEFSWLFYEQHQVSTGIRDAARYIARSAWLPAPPASVPSDVQTAAKNLAVTGNTQGSGAPRVSGWTTGNINIQVDTQPCITTCQGNATTLYDVHVSTSFTPASLGFLAFLQLGTFTLNMFHNERLNINGT